MAYIIWLAISFFMYVLSSAVLNVLESFFPDSEKRDEMYTYAVMIHLGSMVAIGWFGAVAIVKFGLRFLT